MTTVERNLANVCMAPLYPMCTIVKNIPRHFLPVALAEAESVFWDELGRAWARDAYGRCDFELDPQVP